MTIQYGRLISTLRCDGDLPMPLIVEQFSLSAENARLRATVAALSATVAHLTRRMPVAWLIGVTMGAGGMLAILWAIGGLR